MTAGATDNALGAPDNPPPETRGPEADVFLRVGPSLALRFLRPRTVHEVSYTYNIHLYQEHSEATSHAHHLAWAGELSLSPNTRLMAGATAVQGRLASFNLYVPQAAEPRPAGSESYLTVNAREHLMWDAAPGWALEQNTTAASHRSLEDAPATSTTLEISNSAMVERSYPTSALAGIVRLGCAFSFPRPGDDTAPVGDGLRFLLGLDSRGRVDFGYLWSAELRLGAEELVALRPDTDAEGPFLSGIGALRYLHDEGMAELALSRQVRTDLFFGGAYLAEEMGLRGVVPPRFLPDRVGLAGHTVLGRIRNLDEGGLERWVYGGDVTVTYRPSDALHLDLQYVIHRQLDSSAAIPDLSTRRQAAMLTLRVMYPPRRPAPTPRQAPLRVDRADQTDEGRR